jgi:hypothetical protein
LANHYALTDGLTQIASRQPNREGKGEKKYIDYAEKDQLAYVLFS